MMWNCSSPAQPKRIVLSTYGSAKRMRGYAGTEAVRLNLTTVFAS